MSTTWLSGAKVVDLHGGRGNGPFGNLKGVILHVNVDEHGTPDGFWRNNPDQVTPNFEVYKNGDVHQMLPFNWQPWCQIEGNFNYAAIETAGMPDELLTHQQVESIARIFRVYNDHFNVPFKLAQRPGQRGFGTHKMGGAAWGGHDCPGDLRAAQRGHILNVAEGLINHPAPHKPPVHVVSMRHHAYPLKAHNFFGPITGPDNAHGGAIKSEQPYVKAIQKRLQALHYAPRTSGWADGLYEKATQNAVAAFQHHYHLHATHLGWVGLGTWNKLFTY